MTSTDQYTKKTTNKTKHNYHYRLTTH